MKNLLLLALSISGWSACALPTYEPFTEFGPLVLSNGSNLVCSVNGHVLTVGTTGPAGSNNLVAPYDFYLTNCLDFSSGGLADPMGEPWTIMHFGGTNTSVGTANSNPTNWIHGLDVAIISDSLGAIFPNSLVGSLLPPTFPGYPASGLAITNMLENPAQPDIWNGTALVESPNIVGNSAVLNLSQDITRPASGTQTIYVSYLFKVAQVGQLGAGNNGRYFAFLCQSNLNAGPGSTNSYPSWSSMFNTFNTTTAPHYAAHGLLTGGPGGSLYIGPCDTSAGKDFSTSIYTITINTPAFIVGCYAFHGTNNPTAYDTNAMWVNPATTSFGGANPPVTAQLNLVKTNSQMTDIAGLVFIDRIGNGALGGVGTNYIANLLVGTTWSYVTGGPEFTDQPVASTSVNIGQNVSLTGNATAAGQGVTYQWQKVSGGTTNRLTDGAGSAGGTAIVSGSGTATLTLTGIGSGDAGSFQLVATASSTGYTLTSSPAAVALSDPQIISSPANITVNYAGTTSFTAQVNTVNGPLSYVWYQGTTPLTNGAQPDGSLATGASGTTAAGTSFTLTLSLSGVSYQDAGSYTLVVTNSISVSDSTAPATLAVNDPCIVTQPASPAVAAGGNAAFTVVAAGSPTVSYQWYEGATALSDGGTTATGSATVGGSQTATLTLTNVGDADNGGYYCSVTGSGSGQSTNSAVVTLMVQDPLMMATPPRSLAERMGDHLAFAVDVVGGGAQYQWQFDGNPITGATNRALVLTNVQTANTGTYSVTVENLATAPQTYSATLTVINSDVLPLASTNILVARVGDGAQTLSGATGNTLYLDQYTPDGTYVSTVQVPDESVGAPYGAGSSSSVFGSPALIFQGTGSDAPTAAMLTISGGNQQFIGMAGYCQAYPFGGTDVTAYLPSNWRGLATIDAFGIYSLAYTNYGFYSGGNHTIRSMVTLDGTNFWTTGQAGAGGVKFANSTVNSYANGNGIPTITSSATGPRVVQIVNGNLMFSDAGGSPGIYSCVGTPEPLPSNNSGSTQLIAEGGFPIDFAFSPDQNTVYIADGQGFSGTNSQGGGIERWDTNAAGGGYSFSYALPVDPTQTLGALGLAVDFRAAGTWGPGVVGATLYATTYGAASNSLVSLVDNGVGSTPTVLVTAGGNNALRGVRFGPVAVPPTIIAGPQDQTNFPGNSVTFTVAANGSAPFYYQWYGPSGFIPGATNSSFTTNEISYASAGSYNVVVSNPTGISVTNAGSLTVTAGAPTISPAALPNYQETVGDHLGWAPVITGTLPITYNWYKSGNATPILSGTITNLAAGNDGLVLANIQTTDAGTYSLVVNNLYASATNASGGILSVTTNLQTLSSNNVVVARIGDGVQPLSGATGNTLYLDQYTPGGSYVSTIQVPDEGVGQPYGTGSSSSSSLPPGSQSLLFAGAGSDAAYEAMLTLSPDGQNLTFCGYVQGYPFAGTDVSVGANQGLNWRGIASVNAYGYSTLLYTNTGLYSGGLHQIHSAVDIDGNGTNFYTTGQAGGGNGVKYCSTDNELFTGLGIVNISGSFSGSRVAQIVNGNLVFSDVGASPAGIYGFSGLPNAPGTAGLLIAETNSPTDFAASPDGRTVYIADNGAFNGTNSPAGGIQRWDGVAPSSYTYSYTLATGAGSTAGARSLTADFSAQGAWGVGVTGAKLFVTTAEASGNRLIEIIDNGPASAAMMMASATPGQIYSGVRFGPMVVPPDIALQPQSATPLAGSSMIFSAGAGGTGPFTYQWYFQPGGVGSFNAISGATNATYTIGSVANGNIGNYYVIATSPSSATAQSQTVALTLAVPPHFTSETYLGTGQGFEMFFTGTAGLSYSIYTTTDLTLGRVAWTQLTTGGTLSGGVDGYTDPSGGANPQQFYIITSP